MPAENLIYPFATLATSENILSDGQYEADEERLSGNVPGIARQQLVNKALKQSASISYAIAEVASNISQDTISDDGDGLQNLIDFLSASFLPAFSSSNANQYLRVNPQGTGREWVSLPVASTTAAGIVNTSAQSFAGVKTFTNGISGNLTGNVTGNVNGTVTGSLIGNADTASKLATARSITLSGVTATAASFDGSADATIAVTAVPASLLTGTIASARLPVASTTAAGAIQIATDAEANAGTNTTKAVTPAQLYVSSQANLIYDNANRLYSGKDLSTAFSSEISSYSDVWAWIAARTSAANYDGIMVGDYIPFQMNGYTFQAQIAGIDSYYRTCDSGVGHHIDFISKQCYPATVQWNTTNNNNGNATTPYPWLVSNIYSVLNNTWWNYLPTALKNQVITKRFLLESRYSSSGALTSSSGWDWQDLGNLWLPSEYEVFGSNVWSTQGYGSMMSMQYPLFANSASNRLKGTTSGGRVSWWLLSVSGFHSTTACYVGYTGDAGHHSTSHTGIYAPVCFRIG